MTSVAGVDKCFGQAGDQKMTDEAIMQRVKTDHAGSVLKAVLHECVPNGCAHAILRRDTLIKSGKDPCSNFEINQQYDLYEAGDNGYVLPTLKVVQNSYMPPDAAEKMFNITGGVAQIKDSTYGQGQNVLALTMSADIINEVHSYDARTREGSTTLFCLMQSSRTGQATPDHMHLTILWFVNDDEDIVFLHPGGEDHDDVKHDKQLHTNLNLFWQHTLHVVRKKSGALNPSATRTRIEETVLPDVIARANNTWNESQVVMYFTGQSWLETPPFQKREEGLNNAGNPIYDILCREQGSSQGLSLAKGLIKEWCDMKISTSLLPNGETICYNRGFQVCGEDIENLCERDKYNDWVASHLEAGLSSKANHPTEKYEVSDFTEGKSALMSFRLHPDAEPTKRDYSKNTAASHYEKRNAQTDQELGFIMKSGGFTTYLARMHGSDQQLADGEIINLEHFTAVTGTPRVNDLVSGVSAKNTGDQDRQKVVDFGVWLGLNPDIHGNFFEEDEGVLDDLFGGGRKGMGLSVCYSFLMGDEDYEYKDKSMGVRGGLKSQGITDYFPKLYQYDVVCSVEHDLRMTPSKTLVADAGDSHRLLCLRRRAGVNYVLEHDPRFEKYRRKMEDPTWVPIEYDNEMEGGKVVGFRSARPARGIGDPLTDKQKVALKERIKRPQAVRDKHREQNQKLIAENAASAPDNIYKYLVRYGCRLAGVGSYDELNQMKLSPNSPLYKIRALLRHKNGVAMLKTQNTIHLAIRHPQLAMHQLLDAVNNLPRPDDMNDLPPAVEERMRFLEQALLIQAENCKQQLQTSGDKNVSGFKTSNTKSKPSSADKKRGATAGDAGPSGIKRTKVVEIDSDDEEEMREVRGKEVTDALKELRPASPSWKHTTGPKRYKRKRPAKGKFAHLQQERGESSGSEMSEDNHNDSGYESECS